MPRIRTARRSAQNRVFLISGLSTTERTALGKCIENLGGVYVRSDSFRNTATHVICGKLSRSEKFLGALALGRWVVRPEYVRDSYNAGKWLDEISYEWSILGSSRDKLLAAAAKRARWKASVSTEKIFQDWQVTVMLKDTSRQNVYKRLLAYGGAKVFDIKLPVSESSSLAGSLTYLFTDQEIAPCVSQLQQCGVLCLNADFISDYLIVDPPPDPMDYAFMTQPSPSDTYTTSESASTSDVSNSTLAISGLSGRAKSGVLLSQVDEDANALILSQSVAEREMEEETKECPVIVSPKGTHCFSWSKPVAVASSSQQNTTAQDKPKTPRKSVVKRESDSCDQILLADVKHKMQELKKEVYSFSSPKLLIQGRLTSSKSSQRTLRDWFIPKGKENGCGEGVLHIKREQPSTLEQHKLTEKSVSSLLAEKRPVTNTSKHEQERSSEAAMTSHSLRKSRRKRISKSACDFIAKHAKQTGCLDVWKPFSSMKRKREDEESENALPREQKVSVSGDSAPSVSKMLEVSAQPGACRQEDRPMISQDDVIVITDSPFEESDDAAKPGDICVKREKAPYLLQDDIVVISDSQSEDSDDIIFIEKESEERLNLQSDKLQKTANSPGQRHKTETSNSQPEQVDKVVGSPHIRHRHESTAATIVESVQQCNRQTVCASSPGKHRRHESTEATDVESVQQCSRPTVHTSSPEKYERMWFQTDRMTTYLKDVQMKNRTTSSRFSRTVRNLEKDDGRAKAVGNGEAKVRCGNSTNTPTTTPVKAKCKRKRTVRGLFALQAQQREEDPHPLPSELTSQQKEASSNGDAAGQQATSTSATLHPDSSSDAVKEKDSSSGTCANGDPQTSSSDKVFPIFSEMKAAAEAKKRTLSAVKKAHKMKPVRRKGPFFQQRWRLSTVPVPGGWVLDSASVAASQALGSQVIPDALSMMVGTCLEEGYYEAGVSTATSLNYACPSADMVGHMVKVLQESANEGTVNQAYSTLMKWLDLFSPVSSAMRSVYGSALKLSDWEFVKEIFEMAICSLNKAGMEKNEGKAGPGACLLLKFLRAVLERNFLHFLHNGSKQTAHTCLVVRCLWSPSYLVYPNSRTRQLLQFLESSIRGGNSSMTCWDSILGVVTMAAQCCQLVGCGWKWDAAGNVDQACTAFIHDMASAITAGCADCSPQFHIHIISRIDPPWLQREICGQLLADFDDYLVPGGLTPEPVTLKKIVSRYIFLMPRLLEQVTAVREDKSLRKKCRESTPDDAEERTARVPPKLTANKINKRNPKGETMLHRAAIKNDVSLLKQCLAVPGVDVNAKDNYGWTPLHEACNHGNTECVKALLKFAPGKTIDAFFRSGNQKACRVDIHAASDQGITPLHDAVICNHMDIIKLLLKYGGPSLLNARTVNGYTALDLAETEGMKQVLSSCDLNQSLLQDSFSQDLRSQDQPAPTSFMYSEVVSNGDRQLAASLEDCGKLLSLLTCLLRSQLKVQQQRQQPHQQQQQPDQQQWQQETSALFQRHIRKLTTQETYQKLQFKLDIFEALLSECTQEV